MESITNAQSMIHFMDDKHSNTERGLGTHSRISTHNLDFQSFGWLMFLIQ